MDKSSNHIKSLKALNQRRLVAYPREKTFKIFIGHCKKNKYLRTELLVLLIESYIDKLPESEKNECLELYRTLFIKNESLNLEDGS